MKKQLSEHAAVITVVGFDTIGIIAKISSLLAEHAININDITQTLLDELFTMIMIVDLEKTDIDIKGLGDKLENIGTELGLSIRIQHASLFNAMHRI